MTHLVGAAAFVVFVALVLVTSRFPTRRLQGLLILHVLGATLLASVSQRDLWPFSSWRLMTGPIPDSIGLDEPRIAILVRSADDELYQVDHRAVEPLDLGELRAWLRQYAAAADTETLEGLCRFVVERSESARLRVRGGEDPGYFASILGRFAAPKHFMYRNLWNSPADVPAEPFVDAEFYAEHWSVRSRATDTTAYELRSIYSCDGSP